MSSSRLAWLLLAAGLPGQLAAAPDPFSQHVRPTDPLTPEQELAALHVPAGFEIQLFASEPQINKPMNMAFDVRGRLWVTSTVEYPFPAPLDKPGRDAVKILEDSDGDGRADRVTTFADGLNIPTGILPYRSGCIVWSIPNIWFLDDTDGDGACDERTKLYGPLGWERDTHGMHSSFRLGFDGWVYATHGFNNETLLVGRDGHEVRMQSGHTYRFRPDGSRAEHHTFGQVNPFGLCFDSRGNLYSADCHSWPITQLLRGAYYPSFGKPHDGLGFAPKMIDHTHNSTGLCGLVYIEDETWPEDYRGNMLLGNVLTCRVNRDKITFSGSSPKASKQADLIESDDPWFRPVDLQFGPDGALYVADFYNRIIGHYEVPLDHPGRDRERGRIWRIVPKASERALDQFDLTKFSQDELFAALASSNLTLAKLAYERLAAVDLDSEKPPPLTKKDARAGARALWLMKEHRRAQPAIAGATRNGSPLIRIHALRILDQIPVWQGQTGQMVLAALGDSDPHVTRAAAGALGSHPSPAAARALARALARCPEADSHLSHTLRMALRDNLTSPGAFDALAAVDLSAPDSEMIASFAADSGSQAGALFALSHLQKHGGAAAERWLPKIATSLAPEEYPVAMALAREAFVRRSDLQLEILLAFSANAEPTAALRGWAAEVADRILSGEAPAGWQVLRHPDRPPGKNPFFKQTRRCSDGREAGFLCSLPPGGEMLTGILRSPPFALPAAFSFFLAGHDGYPDQPAGGKNFIRLLDAENGTELTRAAPPRNDTAQLVRWNLPAHAGRTVIVEIVDGDTAGAYAWLAAGRFDHADLAVPDLEAGGTAGDLLAGAAQLVAAYSLDEKVPHLRERLADPKTALSTKASLAGALAAIADEPVLAAAAQLLHGELPPSVQQRVVAAFEEQDPGLAEFLFATGDPATRRRVAESLAGSVDGARVLLQAASPAEFLTPSVKAKLDALPDEALRARFAKATSELPSRDGALDASVAERIARFATASPDRAWGGRVFSRHCSICHQLGGEGKVIGPQLDGVQTRGAGRLIEDILAPNRHVDPTFRLNVATLKDGSVRSGMPRGLNGTHLRLIDAAGVVTEIARAEIATLVEAPVSVMPTSFATSLNDSDFAALVGFLMAQGTR